MRISDWSSDVCSSDRLRGDDAGKTALAAPAHKIAHCFKTGFARFPADAVVAMRGEQVRLIDGHNRRVPVPGIGAEHRRSEEHTSELQSLMRISYAVFCLKKKQIKRLRGCISFVYLNTTHSIIDKTSKDKHPN